MSRTIGAAVIRVGMSAADLSISLNAVMTARPVPSIHADRLDPLFVLKETETIIFIISIPKWR
jgi:hypothetical protein